jgi:hypothetical protein
MKSNNNNNNDDDDDDGDNNNSNNNNTAMGSVHARGDTFLTFGLKAVTETNTSRLATGVVAIDLKLRPRRLLGRAVDYSGSELQHMETRHDVPENLTHAQPKLKYHTEKRIWYICKQNW